MSGQYRDYEGKYVRITLLDGRIIKGFAELCLAAEDDSDGVEFDSIQIASNRSDSIYFSDEIKSVEIIEP